MRWAGHVARIREIKCVYNVSWKTRRDDIATETYVQMEGNTRTINKQDMRMRPDSSGSR
jgi:hypothetical protein